MADEPKIRRRWDGFYDVSGVAGHYAKQVAIRVARGIKAATDAADSSGHPYIETNPGEVFTGGRAPFIYTATELEGESADPPRPTQVSLADGSVVAFDAIAPGQSITRTDDAFDDHLDGADAGGGGGMQVHAFGSDYDFGTDGTNEGHGRALSLSRPAQRTNGTETGGDFLALPNSDTGAVYGVPLGGPEGCTINAWGVRLISNGVQEGDPILVRLIKNHNVVLSTKTIDGGDTGNHTYVEEFALAAGDCVDIYVIVGEQHSYNWDLQPAGFVAFTSTALP